MTRAHLGTFRGFNYRNPEPTVTMPQALLSAGALVVFVGETLMWVM